MTKKERINELPNATALNRGLIRIGPDISVDGNGTVSLLNAVKPIVLFKHNLYSSGTPQVGNATSGYLRSGDVHVLGSTSSTYISVAANVPAYTYDTNTGKTRFVVRSALTSLLPVGANRNLTTNWTTTNVTVAKDQTGLDAVVNSASSIVATQAGGFVSYVTSPNSSVQRTLQLHIKRLVGGGRILISQDGNTYIDVTSQVVSTVFTQISLTQTVLNPTIIIRLESSSDSIAVDGISIIPNSIAIEPLLSSTVNTYGATTQLYSAITPNFVAGKHYRLSFSMRNDGYGLAVKLQSSDATQYVNTLYTLASGWVEAVVVSGAIQHFISGNNAGLGIVRNYIGKEINVQIDWGLGKYVLRINGVPEIVSDIVANKLDPVSMDQILISGGCGLISDLKIEQIISRNLLLVGDSRLTMPEFISVANTIENENSTEWYVRNKAIPGNTIQNIIDRYATDFAPTYDLSATKNIALIVAGTNSLASNVSVSTALTQLTTLITSLKTTGFTVIVATEQNRTSAFVGITAGDFETARLSFNTSIRSGITGADYVLDIGGMAETQSATNTLYYNDGIHWNGHLINLAYSRLIRPLLDKLK